LMATGDPTAVAAGLRLMLTHLDSTVAKTHQALQVTQAEERICLSATPASS